MDKSTLVKTTINELVEQNTLSVEALTQKLTDLNIQSKVELTDGTWNVFFKTEDSGDSISMTHLEFSV